MNDPEKTLADVTVAVDRAFMERALEEAARAGAIG